MEKKKHIHRKRGSSNPSRRCYGNEYAGDQANTIHDDNVLYIHSLTHTHTSAQCSNFPLAFPDKIKVWFYKKKKRNEQNEEKQKIKRREK